MKSFRAFGFEVELHFRMRKVSRLSIYVPKWASDHKLTKDKETGEYAIVYYRGFKLFRDALPACKEAKIVNVEKADNGVLTYIIDIYK